MASSPSKTFAPLVDYSDDDEYDPSTTQGEQISCSSSPTLPFSPPKSPLVGHMLPLPSPMSQKSYSLNYSWTSKELEIDVPSLTVSKLSFTDDVKIDSDRDIVLNPKYSRTESVSILGTKKKGPSNPQENQAPNAQYHSHPLNLPRVPFTRKRVTEALKEAEKYTACVVWGKERLEMMMILLMSTKRMRRRKSTLPKMVRTRTMRSSYDLVHVHIMLLKQS